MRDGCERWRGRGGSGGSGCSQLVVAPSARRRWGKVGRPSHPGDKCPGGAATLTAGIGSDRKATRTMALLKGAWGKGRQKHE